MSPRCTALRPRVSNFAFLTGASAFVIHPCVPSCPSMDFSASRTVHGEFKIQSIENNYVCGNAGRNGLSEQRARDPNVGHGAALDREIMRELSLVPRGPKGERLPCYGPRWREAASGHQSFSTSARRILLSTVVRHRFLAVWLDLHVTLGLRRGSRFGSQGWRLAPKRWRAPQLSFEPAS
jgi:hypothetical protein